MRIEPSPEWSEYGYPGSVAEAMRPAKWSMEVGAVTAALAPQFAGKTPEVMYWPTLNTGPEQHTSPGEAGVTVLETAEIDVLVEEEDLV